MRVAAACTWRDLNKGRTCRQKSPRGFIFWCDACGWRFDQEQKPRHSALDNGREGPAWFVD